MDVPSRRLHARYACKLPLRIPGTKPRSDLEGVVLNIGMGGCYIRVKGSLRLGPVRLEVASERDRLAVEGEVIRTSGVDPKERGATVYGVEFSRDERTRGKVRVIVDRVRSSGTGGISLPMANYW